MKASRLTNPLKAVLATAILALPMTASADEGGVSFWLPGLFGSLAAAPQPQPGWSFASIYYHTTVSAGGDVSLAREFEIRSVPANLSATLNASFHSTADLGLFVANYAFATPVLGGQFSLGMMGAAGNNSTSLAGTLSGSLSNSLGSISFSRSDSFADSVTGFGDLYPQAALKWNQGVNNYMAYMTGDIPVGDYDFQSFGEYRYWPRCC